MNVFEAYSVSPSIKVADDWPASVSKACQVCSVLGELCAQKGLTQPGRRVGTISHLGSYPRMIRQSALLPVG